MRIQLAPYVWINFSKHVDREVRVCLYTPGMHVPGTYSNFWTKKRDELLAHCGAKLISDASYSELEFESEKDYAWFLLRWS